MILLLYLIKCCLLQVFLILGLCYVLWMFFLVKLSVMSLIFFLLIYLCVVKFEYKMSFLVVLNYISNIVYVMYILLFYVQLLIFVFFVGQVCLDDFIYYNIDVVCNFLEICGRFLYRFFEITIRMVNMLEILMRLKNVKNLDFRYSIFVENVYYLCKFFERFVRVFKVRFLLYQVGFIYWFYFIFVLVFNDFF